MANAVYPKYKQSALSGDASTDLIQSSATTAPFVAMVDTGTYTYSSSHQFYSSLSGIVGTDQQITTPTATNGTFDGDDVTYNSVSGASVEALVIYRKNAGANTTWRLVLYLDSSVTGLPVTPNGGNIVVTWNASGIFLISDLRLKENIALAGTINDLPIYSYNYAGMDPSQRCVGFLAQEVENFQNGRLAPSIVEFKKKGTKKGGGKYKAVNYTQVLDRLAA